MNSNQTIKQLIKFLSLVLLAITVSCQPEELGDGNGITASDLDASFEVTAVADANNTYKLTANKTYITSSWDLGDGGGFSLGGTTKEAFFPDAGSYDVRHKVTGIGGNSAIISKVIDIEKSDPAAGNLVRGGKFEDEDAHAEWTILNISASGAAWTFNEGSATIQGGGWNQQGIYQTIEVEGGKKYKIDMVVSGENNNNIWFEVFASTVEPTQFSDYGHNVVMGLNTWQGCGTGSFKGLLSVVGCVENSYSKSKSNEVTFDESGTIYLVIKCGGEQASGVTISNVEFRGTK